MIVRTVKHTGRVHIRGCFSAGRFGKSYNFTPNLDAHLLKTIYERALSHRECVGSPEGQSGASAPQNNQDFEGSNYGEWENLSEEFAEKMADTMLGYIAGRYSYIFR